MVHNKIKFESQIDFSIPILANKNYFSDIIIKVDMVINKKCQGVRNSLFSGSLLIVLRCNK